MATIPRRSARLAALATEEISDTSHAQPEISIGKFQLIFEDPSRSDTKPVGGIDTARPVPIVDTIPYSRWKARGYDHDTSNRFVSIQKNLKSVISRIQHNQVYGGGLSLTIAPTDRTSITGRDLVYVLPHDRLLCSHWEAFAAALEDFNGDYHTMFLCFTSVQLTQPVLKMLFPALTSQPLTSLYFQGNNLQRHELLLIADLVAHIPTLEALAICRNMIGNQKEEVVARLSTAIRYSGIQRLALSSCGIGDNEILLSCIRSKSLKSFDLSGNGISTEGAYLIGKFLAKCKDRCVKHLNLEDNKFNDRDAYLFASSLRQNKSLTSLDLKKNNITANGRKILLRALFDCTSLNALSDSNHTCHVKLLPDSKSLGTCPEKGTSAEMVHSLNNPSIRKYYGRKSKIHSMIFSPSCGGSNLRYFEDVPIECFPRVFDLLQYSFPGDFDRLHKHTLVYDLLRATPSVFVSLASTQSIEAKKTASNSPSLLRSIDQNQSRVVVARKRKYVHLV